MTGKAFWHGFDKKGNPIIIIKVKRHIPKKIAFDETIRFFLLNMEIGIKKAEESGTGRITVLWDREGNSKFE